MLIARVQDSTVLEIADHQALFPNTSFPQQGVTPEFMQENSLLPVNMHKSYDFKTQKLVSTTPVIENGEVFTVQVVDKSPEELAEDLANYNASAKAARAAAYREQADPLFFKAQRGEATQEAWLAKVAEIKAQYPTTP
jgi:hypothetical protein